MFCVENIIKIIYVETSHCDTLIKDKIIIKEITVLKKIMKTQGYDLHNLISIVPEMSWRK